MRRQGTKGFEQLWVHAAKHTNALICVNRDWPGTARLAYRRRHCRGQPGVMRALDDAATSERGTRGNDQREARIIDLDSEDGEVGPGALSIPGPSRAQLLIGSCGGGCRGRGLRAARHGAWLGREVERAHDRPATGDVRTSAEESPALGGWPVSVDPQYNQTVSLGQTGPSISGTSPVSMRWAVRGPVGWLCRRHGRRALRLRLRTARSTGSRSPTTAQRTIWIFGPDGKLRIQEPINVGGYSSVVPGRVGAPISSEPQGGDAGESTIQIVEPYGSGPAIVTPGCVGGVGHGRRGRDDVPGDPNAVRQLAIFPGYALSRPQPGTAPRFGPDGAQVWRGMALAPDGTLYAWGFDIAGDGQVVATSQLAAFDSSGRSKPGCRSRSRARYPCRSSAPTVPLSHQRLLNARRTWARWANAGRVAVMLPAGETLWSRPAISRRRARPITVVDDSGKLAS